MKIFVINLRRRTDRRASMEKQLTREKLQYEIIPAIEPHEIPKAEVSEIYNKGMMYQPNEIACSASHKLIYDRMIRENLQKVLVMEDDLIMPVHFSKFIEALDKRKYDNVDWLQIDYPSVGFKYLLIWLKTYFGFFEFKILYYLKFFVKFPAVVILAIYEQFLVWFIAKSPQSKIPTVVPFFRNVNFTSCYIVTLAGAKKLQAAQTPLTYTADLLPNILRKQGNFNMRVAIPLITYQDTKSFGSDLLLH